MSKQIAVESILEQTESQGVRDFPEKKVNAVKKTFHYHRFFFPFLTFSSFQDTDAEEKTS